MDVKYRVIKLNGYSLIIGEQVKNDLYNLTSNELFVKNINNVYEIHLNNNLKSTSNSYKIVAQSHNVYKNIPLFDLVDELDNDVYVDVKTSLSFVRGNGTYGKNVPDIKNGKVIIKSIIC